MRKDIFSSFSLDLNLKRYNRESFVFLWFMLFLKWNITSFICSQLYTCILRLMRQKEKSDWRERED